jgi:hypothetical protein
VQLFFARRVNHLVEVTGWGSVAGLFLPLGDLKKVVKYAALASAVFFFANSASIAVSSD